MAYSEELADRVREQLAGVKRITEVEMFGGLGFMVSGNMICGVRPDGLLVRLRPDLHHDALTRPYVDEMEMGGRTMKGFVTVAHGGLEDDADLELWVRLGLSYAQTFPPKAAKKAAKKKAAAKKVAATRNDAPAKKKAAVKKKVAAKKQAGAKKKATAKKATAKKATAKKATAKKATAKKATAKQATAKKAAKRR